MLRRSHLFLGITSTFGEFMSFAQGNNKPTRPRIESGSPDPESDALTTRPVHSPTKRVCGYGLEVDTIVSIPNKWLFVCVDLHVHV